ncbi:MAG TPA: hypothetical protein VFN99_08470 [Gaiella sp.]|nr:hypothetical protein [Gaiella sp.]
MTPEERAERERRLAETQRMLLAQMDRLKRQAAEQREREERWERSFMGRLSRRLRLG